MYRLPPSQVLANGERAVNAAVDLAPERDRGPVTSTTDLQEACDGARVLAA
jgi:hypothetical protein